MKCSQDKAKEDVIGIKNRLDAVEKGHEELGLAHPMEVVCMATKDKQAVPTAGNVRVTQVDYSRRTCNIEVSADGDGAIRIEMLWLLDDVPSALQRAPDVEEASVSFIYFI